MDRGQWDWDVMDQWEYLVRGFTGRLQSACHKSPFGCLDLVEQPIHRASHRRAFREALQFHLVSTHECLNPYNTHGTTTVPTPGTPLADLQKP